MTPVVRLGVGLGIPALAVVVVTPLLLHLDRVVLGLPVGVLWLFGCIPLTAACLSCCWWWHDRHQPDETRDEARP